MCDGRGCWRRCQLRRRRDPGDAHVPRQRRVGGVRRGWNRPGPAHRAGQAESTAADRAALRKHTGELRARPVRLSSRLRRESVVLQPRRRVCGATQGRLLAALHRAALCRRARHEHLHVAPASHLAARGGPRGAGRARRPAGQQDPRVRCAARATPSPLPSNRRPAPRRRPTLSSRRKATPAWARWLPSRTSSRPLFACWRSTWRRKSAPEERGSRFLRRERRAVGSLGVARWRARVI
mmetsp:Transcript_41225/g.137139  ORF Transcript_41225/g.137139 Transcript_41225/m.137139 type:complete len:238 (+) Transcript_41225:219-932(+)